MTLTDVDQAIIDALEGPSPPSTDEDEKLIIPVSETPASFPTESDHWGPLWFEKRRTEWIAGTYRANGGQHSPDTRHERPAGGAIERLEEVLSQPGIEEDDIVWDDYLQSIHAKLVGGTKVRKGMSLKHAVCVYPLVYRFMFS